VKILVIALVNFEFLINDKDIFKMDYDWICLQFNKREIDYYLIAYAILARYLYKKYHKYMNLVSGLISTFICWKCVINNSPDGIISYYWYDLIITLYKKDWFMVVHHVFTLFSLNQCVDNPDYTKIYYSLFLLKKGDLFVHQVKIIDALELYNDYPLASRIYQLITMSLTLILWIIYRFILPFYVYPFETTFYKISSVIFHIVNLLWIIKLTFSIYKKYKDIKNII
jgi:hypothetical protein